MHIWDFLTSLCMGYGSQVTVKAYIGLLFVPRYLELAPFNHVFEAVPLLPHSFIQINIAIWIAGLHNKNIKIPVHRGQFLLLLKKKSWPGHKMAIMNLND